MHGITGDSQGRGKEIVAARGNMPEDENGKFAKDTHPVWQSLQERKVTTHLHITSDRWDLQTIQIKLTLAQLTNNTKLRSLQRKIIPLNP